MSAAKHTPGPLEVGLYRPTPEFLAIMEHVAVMKPDGSLIAITGSSGGPGREASEADARLYAAAHALLNAATDAAGKIKVLRENIARGGCDSPTLLDELAYLARRALVDAIDLAGVKS